MKLFSKVDRCEGQILPTDSIFTWGKTLREWQGGTGGDVSDYWCFITPFTVNRPHLDYLTFALTRGPCRWCIMVRRHPTSGELRLNQGWIPCS